MNLFVLHYHLNRGGVTQVILNHLSALQTQGMDGVRVILGYGGRRDGLPPELPVQICELPGLEYDDLLSPEEQTLWWDISTALARLDCPPHNTVLHVHNPTLGRNPRLLAALRRLARQGYGLLLQLHDFAEDFRPGNYQRLRDVLGVNSASAIAQRSYPMGSRIHYCVLNGRDLELYRQTGVPPEQLHLLPNPVAEPGPLSEKSAAREKLARCVGIPPEGTFYLCPVRGIRRKNLGEMLLLSLLSNPGSWFGVTLQPTVVRELRSYDRWRNLAGELNLPCRFNLGDSLSFPENLAAADRVLTTSVTEGFGMAFLECWLSGRPLVGRNLPEITTDFEAAGVDLSGLYEALWVPLELVEREQVTAELLQFWQQTRTAYGLSQSPEPETTAVLESLTTAGRIDFARLTTGRQEQVIRLVARNPVLRQQILELNPIIANWSAAERPAENEMIARNAQAVRHYYHPEVIGKQLRAIYAHILSTPANGQIASVPQGELLLDSFLSLDHLYPLRLEP